MATFAIEANAIGLDGHVASSPTPFRCSSAFCKCITQPSPISLTALRVCSESPPNQIGGGVFVYGGGEKWQSLRKIKSPLKLTGLVCVQSILQTTATSRTNAARWSRSSRKGTPKPSY